MKRSSHSMMLHVEQPRLQSAKANEDFTSLRAVEDLDDDFDSGICADEDTRSSGPPLVATEETATLRDLYWSPPPERRTTQASISMDDGDCLVFCPSRNDWIKVNNRQ